MPEEKQRKVHNYLPIMLKDPDMRRTGCAVEAVFRAATDELPPACLEEVRDFCSDWAKHHKGTESDFKKVWVKMVIEHLADAQLRERRLYYRLTGAVDTKPMEAYALKRTADRCDPGDPNYPCGDTPDDPERH